MAIEHKTLRQWLRENGKTQTDFAEENGWVQSSVSKWCNGTPPLLRDAVKIEEITGGEVTAKSFLLEEAV